VSAEVDTRVQTVPTGRIGLLVSLFLLAAAWVPTAVVVTKFVRHAQQCLPDKPSTTCVAFLPGDAASASQKVRTGDLPANKHKGDVLFVTIGLQSLNDLTLDMARQEPNLDLFTREQIYGTKTASEGKKEDLKLMRYSKDFASYVALRRLGYPVKVTGGGVVVAEVPCDQKSADGASCANPSSSAAVVLQVHDVITAIGGVEVQTTADLGDALHGHKPGDRVDLAFTRGTEKRTESIVLIKASDGDRAIVGFIPDMAPPDTIVFAIPDGVKIESGDVGGPSAGLAFTLALLDELTPGDLTGGAKVAVTGEISLNGNVGAIGGLRQKTVAVQRAGATVFLVPASEVKEAEDQAAGSKLKIIGVETLDDALKALADLGGNAGQLGTPGAAIR
jgi:Lon-like protease